MGTSFNWRWPAGVAAALLLLAAVLLAALGCQPGGPAGEEGMPAGDSAAGIGATPAGAGAAATTAPTAPTVVMAAGAGGTPGVFDDRIVFGQSAAFTGPASQLGIGMNLGILAAFAEANREGGVHGRQLELTGST